VSSATPAPTKVVLVATLAITAAAVAVFVAASPDARMEPGFAAPFLWMFSALFLARVAGQLYVRRLHPVWLPPTEQWNLSPYHLLLPTQLAILGVMAWIDVSFSVGSGPPVDAGERFGQVALALSYVYAAGMAVRYAVRMARRPEERWFGGTIPIVFHQVLAAYLFVFGSYHASY
jgi:hypothetical protein